MLKTRTLGVRAWGTQWLAASGAPLAGGVVLMWYGARRTITLAGPSPPRTSYGAHTRNTDYLKQNSRHGVGVTTIFIDFNGG